MIIFIRTVCQSAALELLFALELLVSLRLIETAVPNCWKTKLKQFGTGNGTELRQNLVSFLTFSRTELCVLTMGRNVAWTTKARSGQSYNTKCVWCINNVLSILFIWAYDEYCTMYETKTNNVSSKIFVVPIQTYHKPAIMTKDA